MLFLIIAVKPNYVKVDRDIQFDQKKSISNIFRIVIR